MKPLYYISLLSVLLVACNNDLGEPANGGTQSVAFNVTLDGVSPVETRAIGDMNFGTYGFHIAGYYTYNRFGDNLTDADDYPYPNIFDKNGDTGAVPVPLVKENAKGRYELPLSKLQLSDDTYLSFFAWGQNKTEDGVSGIINNTNSSTNKGCPWLDIQVADAPTSQTDIVASKHMNHKNDYVVSAVDLPFSHILSKLTFKTASSTGCVVKFTSVQVKYGASQVLKKGRFVFDSEELPSLGAYENLSTYHSGTYNLSSSVPSMGDKLILGDMTLLPQKVANGFISLELKYKIMMSNDIEGVEQTRSLPLKALDMQKGNNYIYTIDITADEVRIADSRIGQWKEDVVGSDLPLIAGPRGDVLLLLEGSEAPYTDALGERYWLDHSGYNRHCKMSTSGVSYDSKNRCYKLSTGIGVSAFTVPSLGAPTKLTLDIICTSTGLSDDSQVAFYLSDNRAAEHRRFFTHLAYKGGRRVFFDCGEKGDKTIGSRLQPVLNTRAVASKLAMYTYRYDPNARLQTIARNGILFSKKYYVSDPGNDYSLGVELSDNILGSNFRGDIKYVKITSDIISTTQTASEFNLLKNKYAITSNPSNVEESQYIADGLILNWDGKYPSEDANGTASTTTWSDLSGNRLDGTIVGSLTYTTGYQFSSANANNYIVLGSSSSSYTSLGRLSEYTIEFVADQRGVDDPTNKFTLIFIGNDLNSYLNRAFVVNYPYNSNLEFDSPYGYSSGSDERNILSRSYIPPATTIQWSALRKPGERFSVYKNTNFMNSVTANSTLPEMKYFIVGKEMGSNINPYKGYIYAIRIYNRALTDAERMHNFTLDKQRYPWF